MSDQIKRYNACATEFCIDFIEREDGEVVKYYDHAATVAKLQQQIAELQTAEDESMAVIEKLSRILAEIAIVLKGPEENLHRHGYQDLVELTTVNVLEVQLSRVRIEELQTERVEIARRALEAAAKLADSYKVHHDLYKGPFYDAKLYHEARASAGEIVSAAIRSIDPQSIVGGE